jgi:putative DNA-invertase from lambdoid prophage Rac
LDRLGRNYEDVCDAIDQFMGRGRAGRSDSVHGGDDTGTGRTKAARRAGIAHAKGKDDAKYLGRKPSYTRRQFTMVRHMLGHDAVSIAASPRKMD